MKIHWIFCLLFLWGVPSLAEQISTEEIFPGEVLPLDLEKKSRQEPRLIKKLADKKYVMGVFGSLGLPSFASFGATFFHGEKNDVGISFQAGQGRTTGPVHFDDRYEEILFFANRPSIHEGFFRFVGFGVGHQKFRVDSNFTDFSDVSNVIYFSESEEFVKTYIKLMVSIIGFEKEGLFYGSEFGLTYPVIVDSIRQANAKAKDASSYENTYGPYHHSFNLLRNFFGPGLSFQFNIIKIGYYF